MTLGFPLGLLALVALGPLVAAYFLRRKQPPRRVSALFLWKTPDQRAEAGPRFQRFSREVSLLLESLAIIFGALFLADARCGSDVPRKHVVVIVDGGLSMLARAGAKSSADLVRDAVAKVAKDENASVLTLIESGVRPTVLAGPQLETDRALSLLEAWRPAQPSHDVVPALLLGRELSTSKDQRLHFFTDGPLPVAVVLPPQVEVRSVGKALDNVAFLSAQRRDEDGVAAVTVRVGNFSADAKKVPVRFEAEGGQRNEQELQLASGASAVLRVSFKTTGTVTARLPADALVEDGEITLLPSPDAPVRVALLEGLDAPAKKAVERFLAVAPGLATGGETNLSFGAPGSSAKVTIGAKGTERSFVGPFFAQKGHPVLDDVQLGGVVWTAGENPPGRALMSAGDAVLLSEAPDGALHLNLDVARSNVQRTVAWPVLLGNVVRQVRLGVPGLPRKHVMLGEDVPLVTVPGSVWSLEGPGGRSRSVLGVGSLTLPPLDVPGKWVLKKDGTAVDALYVLPLDPRESDLRTRGPYQVDATVGEALASLALKSPRHWWPLAVLLALVLVDFWLTARKGRAA